MVSLESGEAPAPRKNGAVRSGTESRTPMDHLSSGHRPSRAAEPLWHRVWLDAYPCDVPSSIPYPCVPVSTLMEMAVKRFPDRPACSLYGKTISYSKLARLSHRLARSLAALGAKPGRRVGMLLPNIPEYIVA